MFRPAQPEERATAALKVVIGKIAGGFKGTLELGAAGGPAAPRQVAAADCEQVVSALALMTALAIDPNASTAPVQKKQEPPNQKPERVAAPPSTPQAAVSRRRGASRFRFQLGAALELLAGVAPEPFLLVRPSFEAGTSGDGRWGAAFRVGAGFGNDGSTHAEFSLVSGRLEGCPRFRAAKSLEISLCAAFDAGRLAATGVGVTPTERVNRPWFAPGTTARLEWEILDFLEAEAAGEVFVPVMRDRFFVDAGETVGRAAAVVGGAAIGLGARFP
jgi:hypothetical protein